MQDLYSELWLEQEPVIWERMIHIPHPNYGVRPGFKISLQDGYPLPGLVTRRVQTVIKILQVKANLPCGIEKILVRHEYDTIRRVLKAAETLKWSDFNPDTGRPSVPSRLDYKVSCQPGSGKTAFLSYLLVYRLLKQKPTIYRINDDTCFIFDEDRHGEETSAKALFALPEEEKRQFWVLTDEPLVNANWYSPIFCWYIILAASPRKVKESRDWEKNRNVGVHFMSTWKWGEIFAAYWLGAQTPPTPVQVEKLYTTFTCLSPVPRTCLQTIDVRTNEAYDNTLETYLGQIDREIEVYIDRGGRESAEKSVQQEASHKMAFMDPTKSGLSYKMRIVTRWIAYRVYQVAQQRSQQECFALFQHLYSQDQLRSGAGWMFESYVHDWLRNGGKFEADEIPIRDCIPPKLIISIVKSEPATRYNFTTADTLAEKIRIEDGQGIDPSTIERYFRPRCSNFESLDSLTFSDMTTLVIFQITLAKKHEIKSYGIKKLLRALPSTIKNINIVFVVSADRVRHYRKKQKVPDPARVDPHGVNLNIRQFRLVFSNRTMRKVVTKQPFSVDENEDEDTDSDTGEEDQNMDSDIGTEDEHMDSNVGEEEEDTNFNIVEEDESGSQMDQVSTSEKDQGSDSSAGDHLSDMVVDQVSNMEEEDQENPEEDSDMEDLDDVNDPEWVGEEDDDTNSD